MEAENKKQRERQNIILDYIESGEENAIHQKALAAAAGISCATLKKEIKTLRECGFNIVSSNRGYYIAESMEDLRRFVGSMSRAAASRFGSITAIRKITKFAIDGQMTLEDTEKAAQNGKKEGRPAKMV